MSFHKKLEEKVISTDAIERFVNAKRFLGKKIVFTNGCFDILHAGHVDYLTKARDLGDVLVLGLNSDESVKHQNKGPERPINPQNARANVLASLSCIDAVIYFNEDTPYELIKLVKPDVLVKGGDWKTEDIVGSDIVKARGGNVTTISFVEGFSTTGILAKLKG